jgi:hypothetical protein
VPTRADGSFVECVRDTILDSSCWALCNVFIRAAKSALYLHRMVDTFQPCLGKVYYYCAVISRCVTHTTVCALCSVPCALCFVLCALCSVPFALCSVLRALGFGLSHNAAPLTQYCPSLTVLSHCYSSHTVLPLSHSVASHPHCCLSLIVLPLSHCCLSHTVSSLTQCCLSHSAASLTVLPLSHSAASLTVLPLSLAVLPLSH